VTNVELEARVEGLARPVGAGETLATRAGTQVTVSLRMNVPDRDYLGRENRIDAVELVGVSDQGARILSSGPPARSLAFDLVVEVPDGGIVLRARGRRTIEKEPALSFIRTQSESSPRRPDRSG
jgi:hypothetical protein